MTDRSARTPRAKAAWVALGLAAGAAIVTAPPQADAQRGARAEYTMVAGAVQGASEEVVYIVDAANQEVAAFRWNSGAKSLDPTGYRNIASDAERGMGGGR